MNQRIIPAVAALACLAVAAAAFLPRVHADDEDVDPPPACPFAVGTLSQNMENRVGSTVRAEIAVAGGWLDRDITDVSISLEHVLIPAWTCATWTVELLLPPGTALASGTASRSALTRSSAANFEVELADLHDEVAGGAYASRLAVGERHVHRGAFAVTVFNGGDTPVFVQDGTDAQGRWHIPVEFVAERLTR